MAPEMVEEQQPVMGPYIILPPGVTPDIFAGTTAGLHATPQPPPQPQPTPPESAMQHVSYNAYPFPFPPPPPPPPPAAPLAQQQPVYFPAAHVPYFHPRMYGAAPPAPPPRPVPQAPPAPQATSPPPQSQQSSHHHRHHHHHHRHRHHRHSSSRDESEQSFSIPKVQFIGDLESSSTTEKLNKLKHAVRDQAKAQDELATRQYELERRESKRERKLEGVIRGIQDVQLEQQDQGDRTRRDVDRVRGDIHELQSRAINTHIHMPTRKVSGDSSASTSASTATASSSGFTITPHAEHHHRKKSTRRKEHVKPTHHITVEHDGDDDNSSDVYIHIRQPCKDCKEKVITKTQKVKDIGSNAGGGSVRERLGLIIRDDDIYRSALPEVYCDNCKARKLKEEREKIYQEEKEKREQKEKKIEEVVERVLERKVANGEIGQQKPTPEIQQYPDPSFYQEPVVGESGVRVRPKKPHFALLGGVPPPTATGYMSSYRKPSVQTESTADSNGRIFTIPSTVVETDEGAEITVKIPKLNYNSNNNAQAGGGSGNSNVQKGDRQDRNSRNAPVPPTPVGGTSPVPQNNHHRHSNGPIYMSGALREHRIASSSEERDGSPHETVMHYHHHFHHDQPRRSSNKSNNAEDAYHSDGSNDSIPQQIPQHQQMYHDQSRYRGPGGNWQWNLPQLGQHSGQQQYQQQQQQSAPEYEEAYRRHRSKSRSRHYASHDRSRSRSASPVRRIASQGDNTFNQMFGGDAYTSSRKHEGNGRAFPLPEGILKVKPVTVHTPYMFGDRKDGSRKFSMVPAAVSFEEEGSNASSRIHTIDTESPPTERKEHRPVYDHEVASGDGRKGAEVNMNLSININGEKVTATVAKPDTPTKTASPAGSNVSGSPKVLFFSHAGERPKQQQQQRQLPQIENNRPDRPAFLFGPSLQQRRKEEEEYVPMRRSNTERPQQHMFMSGIYPSASTGQKKHKQPKRVSFSSEDDTDSTLEGNWGRIRKEQHSGGGGREMYGFPSNREEEKVWNSVNAWD